MTHIPHSTFLVILVFALFAGFHLGDSKCYKGNADDHPTMRIASKICKQKINISEEEYQESFVKLNLDTTPFANPNLYIQCIIEEQGIQRMMDWGLGSFIAGMKSKARNYYGPIMLECYEQNKDVLDMRDKSLEVYKCYLENIDKECLYLV